MRCFCIFLPLSLWHTGCVLPSQHIASALWPHSGGRLQIKQYNLDSTMYSPSPVIFLNLGTQAIRDCQCWWKLQGFPSLLNPPNHLSIYEILNRHPICLHCHSLKHKRWMLRCTKAINWNQAIRRELYVNLFVFTYRKKEAINLTA